MLWIGGAPGAGKSTAAWLLAHRHDLRLYPVDASAHAHGARSRGPTMRWFNALPLDQRFERSPAVLADEFLAYSREQFELVLEDLDTYPGSPVIVVEGPQVLPDLAGAHAVFFVPTVEFQRDGLFRRQPDRLPQLVARDALLTPRIREQALALGRTVIEVDGSLDPDEVVARLETLFASVLAAPRPPVDLAVMRHDQNALVNRNLVAAGVPRFPYACECGRGGCTERIELTPTEFATRERVVAPAHER